MLGILFGSGRGFVAVGAFAAVLAAGPAVAETCADPLKPMLRAELFFGRAIGNRLGVTDRLWQRYVDRELTPRFPDGLTVVDGSGRWRAGDAIKRERSKIVIVVTPDNAEMRARIAAAMNIYIVQFKQKSVGLVMQTVCAGF
jgi:hypothetical protein